MCVPPIPEPLQTRPEAAQPRPSKALPPVAPLAELVEGQLPADLLIEPGSTEALVIDLETSTSRDLWAAPGSTAPFIRLVGSDHGNNTDPTGLLDHAGSLVAHNGFGFDFIALAHHHGLQLLALSEQDRLIDTMVLALVLTPPADGAMKGGRIWQHFSLHNCAERAGIEGKADDLGRLAIAAAVAAGYTGSPTERKEFGYGLIPQGNIEYNAYLRGDVAATRGLFNALVPSGVLDAYSQREMRIMGRLTTGIALAGTRVDVELTHQRYEEIEAQKESYRQSLIQKYGLPTTTATGKPSTNPLNCKGADQAITAAAKDLGLKLPRTQGGKASTSKEKLGPLLERCRACGNEQQVTFLETILGLSGARSVYGTTLDWLQADDRIHPSVSPIQASGRFSITKPGITVFGKRGGRVVEREIFLPDSDDHLLIAADLSQIDMRAIAAHAQDPAYLELFLPGRDAHNEVAKAVNMSRSDAKAIGHGWNYGMTVNGMVNRGIERVLADRFDLGMKQSFPILCRWKDRVRSLAADGKKLDNGFGRLMKADPG